MARKIEAPGPIALANAAPLKKSILTEQHGAPEQQKEELVDFIISAFGTPATWPLTSEEQARFMREVYQKALNIRRTEGKR